MKIVTSPTDGNERFVLQESLDHHHRRSTVEGERSEDGNGHVILQPKIEFDDLPVQDPILQPEMDEFLANANDDDSQIDNYSSDTDSSSSDSSYSSSSESEAESTDSDSSDWSVESSSSSDSSTVVQKSKTSRKRKRLVETAKQREERLRKRREHERRQRAAMIPEELSKFLEKRRALNRASKLRMRLKKANELQKGFGLKNSGQKLKRPVAQIPAGKLDAKQVVQQKRKEPLAQVSIRELEKRRRAQRERKRNRLARMTEQERQAHRERIREYDRLWREKKKTEFDFYCKNASSSKLLENDELPLQKQKENRKPQNDAILFEARRLRKNTQSRMSRLALLRSETPEQREERLRKRREQKRKRKAKILQAREESQTDQPETEYHFRQMASMITAKQLTEVEGNRKRKNRNGGDHDDPDDRAKLCDDVPKRGRLSLVDYSDSDDSID